MSIAVLDLVSLVVIGSAAIVAALELRVFIVCGPQPGRWIFLFKAIVALLVIAAFIGSLLQIYAGSDRIPAEVGRPLFVLTMAAMGLGAIYQNRRICR